MTRKIIAAIAFAFIAGTTLAENTQVCKAWNYISNGKAVYCNTCCYGGNCSTSCKQP